MSEQEPCHALPKGFVPKGKYRYDGRVCFSMYFFTDEDDAKAADAEVKRTGAKYNGGWYHGEPCGREPARDYTDEHGVRWYAVTF